MNNYGDYVDGFLKLRNAGRRLQLGGFPFPTAAPATGPKALVFSPHPDDECIIGGLALRLAREAGVEVVNVAVTQGSNKARQPARLEELRNACRYLGFGLATTRENGLEGINRKTREGNPAAWADSVACVAAILKRFHPAAVLIPHDLDANSTHQGTNLLVLDALKQLGGDCRCRVVETEFWAPMVSPNLMVEVAKQELTDLITALSFHVGEVNRNPYHLSLPAWMMDNVRRGGEVVGGQGGAAPDFPFATLYRVRDWTGNALENPWKANRILSAGDKADSILE